MRSAGLRRWYSMEVIYSGFDQNIWGTRGDSMQGKERRREAEEQQRVDHQRGKNSL